MYVVICYWRWCVISLFFFFFQAEDGIRDLVRSRGLGDVYKRQGLAASQLFIGRAGDHRRGVVDKRNVLYAGGRVIAVSYTHLTLPTSDLV